MSHANQLPVRDRALSGEHPRDRQPPQWDRSRRACPMAPQASRAKRGAPIAISWFPQMSSKWERHRARFDLRAQGGAHDVTVPLPGFP